jgi:hypothetical protein
MPSCSLTRTLTSLGRRCPYFHHEKECLKIVIIRHEGLRVDSLLLRSQHPCGQLLKPGGILRASPTPAASPRMRPGMSSAGRPAQALITLGKIDRTPTPETRTTWLYNVSDTYLCSGAPSFLSYKDAADGSLGGSISKYFSSSRHK